MLSLQGPLENLLTAHIEDVGNYIDADGFAILRDGDWHTIGGCPPAEYLQPLYAWLNEKGVEGVFASDQLPDVYQPAKPFENLAAGILALPLLLDAPCFLVWFRAEEIQVVNQLGRKPTQGR